MDIKFKNKLKNCPEGCPNLKVEFSQYYDPIMRELELCVQCGTYPCKRPDAIYIEVAG